MNAGKTTNFIYKLSVNLSPEQLTEINQIATRSKIQDRIGKLKGLGVDLDFIKPESVNFQNNLVLIDSSLPKIISKLLLLFFTTDISKVSDLTEAVANVNPLKYDLTQEHPFYSYKIKRFLSDIALGMMPSKVWTGKLDATGGYLIVKEDGEILCYHIYNQNQFEDYLYKNTKFETASSTRHDFGSIYEENGENYFKLNLQIRFL